jgi:hypothetical protein
VQIRTQAVGPSLLLAVGANGRTLAPALEYMRIRALAAPACLVMNVAQGACIGQQDSWTPLLARYLFRVFAPTEFGPVHEPYRAPNRTVNLHPVTIHRQNAALH